MLMFEAHFNLRLTGAVLIRPAIAAVAFVHLISTWALIIGALLIAAAFRVPRPVVAATIGPTSSSAPAWVDYSLPASCGTGNPRPCRATHRMGADAGYQCSLVRSAVD